MTTTPVVKCEFTPDEVKVICDALGDREKSLIRSARSAEDAGHPDIGAAYRKSAASTKTIVFKFSL